MKRGSGILLHISSLPNNQGIGCFCEGTYKFVDFLADAGMKYWQILPLCPTTPEAGNSPYSAYSVFAGNPLFIDLTKYLTNKEINKYGLNFRGNIVDFSIVTKNKIKALKDIFARGYDKNQLQDFISQNKYWIEPFAEWMVKKNGGEKEFYIFLQMLFFKQWLELKEYANKKGIKIIGDLPFYTSMDSVEVYAYPEIFDLKNGEPLYISGVPPDCFNKDGQVWGHPLYNFRQMEKNGFDWWCNRVKFAMRMCDILRLDHFIAFDRYYKIPYGDTTAKNGQWQKGPGMKFFNSIKAAVPNAEFILEDLGNVTKSVRRLQKQIGYPSMKIMQFGFDGDINNEHLPHNYKANCVAYLGNHDNNTFMGFLSSSSQETKKHIKNYFNTTNEKQQAKVAIEKVVESKANVVVVAMQDILLQSSDHRMNVPGIPCGQWKYRMPHGCLTNNLAKRLYQLNKKNNRT